MTYDLEIPNLDELQAGFARAPEVTLDALTKAMNSATQTLEGAIKKRTPVDTGRLRDSILPANVIKVNDGGTTSVVGSIGTNVKYATYNELGTGIYGPHAIQIVNEKTGAVSDGQQGTFFFRDGLAESTKTINAYFKDALNTITASITTP